MEAHGHEEIEGNVAAFLKQIIKSKFPDVYKNVYSDSDNQKFDDVHNALYLGNWLTDFSQVFAPDSLFEIKEETANKMKNYNEYIESIYCLIEEELNSIDSRLREIIYTGIVYYNEGKKITKNVIDSIKLLTSEELENLEKEAERIIKLEMIKVGIYKDPQLKKLIDDWKKIYKSEKQAIKKVSDGLWEEATANLHQFENIANVSANDLQQDVSKSKLELLRNLAQLRELIKFPKDLIDALSAKDQKNNLKFEYDNREELWELSFAFLKMMGYKKFVRERNMSFDDFILIVDNFIEENTSIQQDTLNQSNPNRFRFKLNQYYPSDHLDRAFSSKNLIYFDKNKGYTKKSYFIDDDIDLKSKTARYKYLDDYIDIAGAKLMHLNDKFILPVFYGIRSPNHTTNSKQDFLINISQIGQTLHAVEDFFAHSNFLELSTYFLDNLQHPVLERNKFYSFDEFIQLLSPDETKRYSSALFKANTFLGNTLIFPNYNEGYIATGFYAEGDMATSFYHVAFGGLEKKISQTEDAGENTAEAMATVSEYLYPEFYKGVEKYSETDKIDTIVLFISELKILLSDKDKFLDIFYKNNNYEYFSKNVFDYIFKNRTQLRTKKKLEAFCY